MCIPFVNGKMKETLLFCSRLDYSNSPFRYRKSLCFQYFTKCIGYVYMYSIYYSSWGTIFLWGTDFSWYCSQIEIHFEGSVNLMNISRLRVTNGNQRKIIFLELNNIGSTEKISRLLQYLVKLLNYYKRPSIFLSGVHIVLLWHEFLIQWLSNLVYCKGNLWNDVPGSYIFLIHFYNKALCFRHCICTSSW